MDLILESIVEQVEKVEDRLNLVFASIPFPGSEFCLEFVREETEGFVYRWEEKNLQGWLSPSLRNYFPEPPPEIYLQLLPVGRFFLLTTKDAKSTNGVLNWNHEGHEEHEVLWNLTPFQTA